MEHPYGPPPPEPRARRPLVWVVLGLGGLVLLQLCVAAALFATMPGLRERALALFARPSGPPPPSQPGPAGGAAEPARPLLLEDSFDAPTSRWDQSGARVADGALELRVDLPSYDGYAFFKGPDEPAADAAPTPASPDAAPTPPDAASAFDSAAVRDFDIAVDVRQTDGQPDAEYGVRFRQSGPTDYLMFSISGRGYYRLVRVRGTTFTEIAPWTFDGRVHAGPDAVNRLRVVAAGADVTAYVNGSRLIQAQDEEGAGGQLTLGLQTYAAGARVQFDNVAGTVGGIDLAEDFSDPELARWSTGGSQISEGAYEIVAGADVQTWQQPLPTDAWRVRDFVLEVDATLLSGDDAAYGVIFGDDGDFNYYTFLLLPAGGVMAFRTSAGGEYELLAEPQPLALVKPGTGQTNTLRLELTGTTLLITINGEDVGQLVLREPPEGMIGLMAVGGTDGARVRFDNVRLEEKTTR